MQLGNPLLPVQPPYSPLPVEMGVQTSNVNKQTLYIELQTLKVCYHSLSDTEDQTHEQRKHERR